MEHNKKWDIKQRKKHNLDEEYFNIEFINGASVKLDVAEARHFIEDLDSKVNCFGL